MSKIGLRGILFEEQEENLKTLSFYDREETIAKEILEFSKKLNFSLSPEEVMKLKIKCEDLLDEHPREGIRTYILDFIKKMQLIPALLNNLRIDANEISNYYFSTRKKEPDISSYSLDNLPDFSHLVRKKTNKKKEPTNKT